MYKKLGIILSVVLSVSAFWYFSPSETQIFCRPTMCTLSAIENLFPHSKDALESMVSQVQKETSEQLSVLTALPTKDRTFANTFGHLDEILHRFSVVQRSIYVLSMTSSDETLRNAAQQAVTQLQIFFVDSVSHNGALYRACRDYEEQLKKENHELLTPEQRYFIDETMREFRQSGLGLAPQKQKKIADLTKKSAQIALEYEAAYTADSTGITVPKEGLKGLEESFIKSLERTDDGLYRIPLSYDKFFTAIEQCKVAQTRKELYQAFMQRGYPENEERLKKVLKISNECAQLLGYPSYAHMSLDEQMAQSPEVVSDFLKDLYKRSYPKAMKELALLAKDLPPGVQLEQGKLQPWDLAYVYYSAKKNRLQVDEEQIAQYFPTEKTIQSLLKVYEQFFGLCFTEVKRGYFWHEEVRALAVYKKGIYIGMILLDLYPRPHKFSHAGHITIVPSVRESSGKLLPAVVVVLANFSREHPDRPAVFTRKEVLTFFHEFGHALHALLGSTELASQSGTSVKGDFGEMPSQMLEEWIWDPTILKKISSHIITKKPLPDELIKKILSIKHFEAGDYMLRQIFLSDVSLQLYQDEGSSLAELWKTLNEKLRPNLLYDPKNKGYCSFPHIMSYGPRYYGYLWSKVYAIDLFSTIKKQGLLNPQAGERYTQEILSKGGSQDPSLLIESFLGRKPSTDAFISDLGL